MNRTALESGLNKYIPEHAVSMLATWIIELEVHLRVSKARTTKLGDYRPPFRGQGHRISINHNLNQYAFLVTLVHELAHLTCWNQYQNKVAPHGAQWKSEYQKLMRPVMALKVFPGDVEQALNRYLTNPAASSCSDPNLQKVLSRYDDVPVVHLEDIPLGSIFRLPNGKVYKRGEKRRTRYVCIDQANKRAYLISGIAEVELVGNT